ncbi:Small heat shock protein HSP16.5 [uncultured archaeon]|nr:Small heat shock protein HSP16.5 [uncultured archaeon]
MKKSNDFDEFIKQLEEAVKDIQDEITASDMPIFIDISINLCPAMGIVPADHCIRKEGRIPVDILETEKNIHALMGLSGVDTEDIKLSRNGKALEITASDKEGALKETIELPARAVKRGMKATYKNGVLEVVLNKSKKKIKDKGTADKN